MKRRSVLQLSAALSIGLALFGGQAFAEAITVTITHSSPSTSHFGVAAQAFKDYIEKTSEGRFAVVVQRLDNEREAMESVQLGAQEFSFGSTGPAGNFVPEVRVFDIPYLFTDYAHARGVLDGEVGRSVLAKFETAGLVGVAFGENGFRHLTTGTVDITSPADLKGLKIRTMENKVHMQAWQAAGVLPTPLAFSELATALQQGVVDGQENPISVILANNFDQLQKHLYLTGHIYSPGILVGNPGFWDGLSPEDRAVFQDAAAAAVKANRDKVEADEREGIAELRNRGMDVQEVDTAAFRDAMASVVPEFETQFGADLIKSIRDWKAN